MLLSLAGDVVAVLVHTGVGGVSLASVADVISSNILVETPLVILLPELSSWAFPGPLPLVSVGHLTPLPFLAHELGSFLFLARLSLSLLFPLRLWWTLS